MVPPPKIRNATSADNTVTAKPNQILRSGSPRARVHAYEIGIPSVKSTRTNATVKRVGSTSDDNIGPRLAACADRVPRGIISIYTAQTEAEYELPWVDINVWR